MKFTVALVADVITDKTPNINADVITNAARESIRVVIEKRT